MHEVIMMIVFGIGIPLLAWKCKKDDREHLEYLEKMREYNHINGNKEVEDLCNELIVRHKCR